LGGNPEIFPWFRIAERVLCPLINAQQKLTIEDYFTKVLEDDLKAIIKPQYVDMIPKAIKGPNKTVGHNVEARSEMGNMDHIMEVLGKNEVGFKCRKLLISCRT
jgi:translation initiation factor RLI1